ncbi:hypothetical protein TNCV_105361 [Trichonephila clavipes]|nr:hypothetical protein TNCV_105361 [Trichonephila clavipes]
MRFRTLWTRMALERYQSRQHPSPFWRFSLKLNTRIRPLGLPSPQSTIGISVLVLEALCVPVLQDRIKLFRPAFEVAISKQRNFPKDTRALKCANVHELFF